MNIFDHFQLFVSILGKKPADCEQTRTNLYSNCKMDKAKALPSSGLHAVQSTCETDCMLNGGRPVNELSTWRGFVDSLLRLEHLSVGLKLKLLNSGA